MRSPGRKPLYQHTGTALLRAATASLTRAPDWWPDPDDTGDCRRWLAHVWSRPDFAIAVREASWSLGRQIDAIVADPAVPDRHVRSATQSTARYLLRSTGRPTPFGLFAGVAHATLGPAAAVRFGTGHRPVARVDTQWLAAVIERLEAMPGLLQRLDLVFNNLAARRGARIQIPRAGTNRVSIRNTSAVRALRDAAAVPAPYKTLAGTLAGAAPGASRARVDGVLADLVRQGFLITSLRAPLTVTDPLGYVIDRLHAAGAEAVASAVPVLRDLEAAWADLNQHNQAGDGTGREEITRRLRDLSGAGRSPLAVDLVLDCDVQLPGEVARELERAATALLRLTRQPTGDAVWKQYHCAFWEKYGTGALVPLTEVLDPAAGLGFPAEYPGSMMAPPVTGTTARDQRLLALAWQTAADRSGEIVLTDQTIDQLAGTAGFEEGQIAPHVEIAARLHAADAMALARGDFTVTVTPARSAGTLTSRFTPVATGNGLAEVYRGLPTLTAGALPAQLSFPPLYPHAENVCRIPAYLPHVIALGEHRHPDDPATTVIDLEDLAVTATRDRLHLVSVSRRQVVEPLVFHAMALDKQAPPLARFLVHLPRAFTTAWTGFDWGPAAAQLPYLPRVSYGRCVLSPARWTLTTTDLATPGALDDWRKRWGCPRTVELRDEDRTLRLNLGEPLHAAILHAHLRRHHTAVLTEAVGPGSLGWLEGHVHEVAVPLVTTRPPAPSPLAGPLPTITNNAHGSLPASPRSRWLNAKLHTHPEQYDEILTRRLPPLLDTLPGAPQFWFVRYRSPNETDHLRLRFRTRHAERYGQYAGIIGAWAEQLRRDGLASGLALDTYTPEVGRYGEGPAMKAAEAVFSADSTAVTAALRLLPAAVLDPAALVAAGMVDITCGFLGHAAAMTWLAERPTPAAKPVGRHLADQAITLALDPAPRWPDEVAQAVKARALALAFYRTSLPADADTASVLESLLHMHHNRALGLDRDSEWTCRRLARQAARAHQAQQDQRGSAR
ncbi:lantibiotic dehydratase [Streptacidiphilus albus]|uniref:lantibiotic dehydratase n=1 Tax=Streptacidiphilus albus TaxID=105425 RepID=UPI00054B7AF1|nr:lantibiotic dehydratase [Streptacidiphilus albus]